MKILRLTCGLGTLSHADVGYEGEEPWMWRDDLTVQGDSKV